MQESHDSLLAQPGEMRDAALAAGLTRLGHSEFRAGQREAIEGLLDARRLLLVAPTGGGKSLCYQLPALLFRARRSSFLRSSP